MLGSWSRQGVNAMLHGAPNLTQQRLSRVLPAGRPRMNVPLGGVLPRPADIALGDAGPLVLASTHGQGAKSRVKVRTFRRR